MRSLARGMGGHCISPLYVNSDTPLRWQCAAGHQWRAVPASIRKGSWCPACAGVKRGTIQEMRKIAGSRGGACLSEGYRNTDTKLSWRCSAGHEWSAAPTHIKKGHWCPWCARVARLTLEEMRRIAAATLGQLLSTECFGSSIPLRWRCAVGHEWDARPASIKSGTWCPSCARNRKLELEEMREIARHRGGKCLSTTYKNGRTPLWWECERGHRWKARPARVKSGTRRKGTWCLECYNSKRVFLPKQSIQAMRELASTRGGKCLSTEYVGSKNSLTWQCAYEHRWEAAPSRIVQGSWCPVCAHNQRLILDVFRDIAKSRGGSCLSQAYVNEKTHLAWCCAAGHCWKAAPDKVKRGSWCAKCASISRRSKWRVLRTNERMIYGAIFRPDNKHKPRLESSLRNGYKPCSRKQLGRGSNSPASLEAIAHSNSSRY